MPFCEAQLAKLIFIRRSCKDCGKLVSLDHIGVEAVYSVKGDSSKGFLDGTRTPPQIIFVLAGKCRCGTENFVKFTPEMLTDAASELKDEADQKGVEEGDAVLSAKPVSQNPSIN